MVGQHACEGKNQKKNSAGRETDADQPYVTGCHHVRRALPVHALHSLHEPRGPLIEDRDDRTPDDQYRPTYRKKHSWIHSAIISELISRVGYRRFRDASQTDPCRAPKPGERGQPNPRICLSRGRNDLRDSF